MVCTICHADTEQAYRLDGQWCCPDCTIHLAEAALGHRVYCQRAASRTTWDRARKARALNGEERTRR